MFGFFETANDPEVAAALLGAATEWARSKGRSRILGPMDFTTNDEIGILIEGFERRPMILELWHPPYYQELVEAEGFEKAMDVLMWELQFGDLKEGERFDPAIHAAAEKALGERRDHDPQHAQARHRGRGAALHGRLQRGLGRQLGLRPDHRCRGRVPGKEPQAGARRGLGLHCRKGRRGGGGRPHPAGHQPGDGEAERAAASASAGPSSCSASARSTSCGSSRWGSSPTTGTPALPPVSTSSTWRRRQGRGRSGAARWAGSSRTTVR